MPFVPAIVSVTQYTDEAQRVLKTLLAMQLTRTLTLCDRPACEVNESAFGERVEVRMFSGPLEVRLSVGTRRSQRDFKGEIAANKMSGYHMLTDEAQKQVQNLIQAQKNNAVYECETEVSWASTHLSPVDAMLFAKDVQTIAEAAAAVEHHFRNVVIDFSRSK